MRSIHGIRSIDPTDLPPHPSPSIHPSPTHVNSAAQVERTGEWQYYVHYHDFNRRMDAWVSE